MWKLNTITKFYPDRVINTEYIVVTVLEKYFE